jgi:hypothetical protein
MEHGAAERCELSRLHSCDRAPARRTQPTTAGRRHHAMNFETAVALLTHARGDLHGVAEALCKLATAALALGQG